MAKPRLVDESDSGDFESEDEEETKVKGKGKGKDKDKPVKRRSSKACDNCRKSKCKCTRAIDPVTNEPKSKCENCEATNAECKFEGTSRKRGPPKGYIEAIESRLHRMEALLGGLLQNDDPRAQALLGELIGDEEAREMLTQDLRAATERTSTSKSRKSWKKEETLPLPPPPVVTRGFGGDGLSDILTGSSHMAAPRHFSEDDLGFSGLSGMSPAPFVTTSSSFGSAQYGMGGMDDSASPGVFASRTDIPVTDPEDSFNPRSGSTQATSPRQRRKLNSAPLGSSSGSNYTFKSQSQSKTALPVNAIGHTGTATYTLSNDAELSSRETEEGVRQMGELADVVGQLSLNENSEVRYHGRSSGLYLISKSARYKDFFWQFPSAGVWPPAEGRVAKTENEILQIPEMEDPLPDRATQEHLLDLYWCYVHPHFPILYKISFMRQYRHGLSNPHSKEQSTPAGAGKVPIVLLLAMFALAARYSDLEPARTDGTLWTAGQDFLDKAQRVLNYDYGSSKLVSVQALLLMAYREIGTGAMSASWLFTGMAIRQAQDLGLFRDVEKWYLPVQKFSHEEKQTRKRVWWGCIILDRYTASYIGRPGTIHERDYDTSFPSEEEPDEQEQWRPIRPDGTDWKSPPKEGSEESRVNLSSYPDIRASSISCFNAAGALAVIINRVIANVYAIRIRVLGQSSETLLSLLDQSLASWFLALPAHLEYNPASKKVPPPHVLALHLQFYSALILLHRPFIPGQNSVSSPTHFPSHSICTRSASAIASIITTFSKTFTLRQCPPFLTYPIFSAAVICVYNAGFDETLARPAKQHLAQCMSALKEMEVIWGSAIRQWELLNGLVDLRDASLQHHQMMVDEDAARGTKRPADSDFASVSTLDTAPRANFHARPLGRGLNSAGGLSKPRRRSIPFTSQTSAETAQPPRTGLSSPPELHAPPSNGMFALPPAPAQFGFEGAHQSYDILSGGGPLPDSPQFRSPTASQNLTDLLATFLAPTEAASQAHHADQATPVGGVHTPEDYVSAFYGLPLGGQMSDDWAAYIPQAFGFQSDSPDSQMS